MTILNQFSLAGKTAVVTGSTRGIGRGIALALAEAGADIVGISKSLNRDSPIGAEVRARGRRFSGHACDIGDRSAIYTTIEKIVSETPRVDILVNAAGIILRQPAAEHPDQAWDQTIEVNLNSQFIFAREFGKRMIEAGSGKIIFIASLLTFQGGITVPGYAASKGAIGQLAKALSNEWAPKNVQVNGIAPGYIRTDNTQALQNDKERNASILARIPSGRWGTPDDIAGAAVFLASPASDYVTGIILTVDGGWMAR
jgi:2-deoxy-D-gluconate 3-dehydrogenase